MRNLRRRLSGLTAALLASAFVGSSAAQEQSGQVDVELVLAADISQSLDLDEHTLQRKGYVEAFRSKDVIDAIASGPRKRIAVTYMEFAGDFSPMQTIPWTIIDSEAAAREFADRLASQPIFGEQQTSISAALYEAARWIDSNNITSKRQVINVSGDGANAVGPPMAKAREDVLKRGIVINGFPIMLNKPREYYDIDRLDRYFERCVIGGKGAFVAPLQRREQVSSALRRAIMAVSAAQGAQPSPQADPAPIDCLAGERAWEAGRPPKN